MTTGIRRSRARKMSINRGRCLHRYGRHAHQWRELGKLFKRRSGGELALCERQQLLTSVNDRVGHEGREMSAD